MIEFTTLVTLCVLYLVFFRPGKTPPLESPLVIERGGKYQLTLAPQLNLAQPYLEAIAAHLAAAGEKGPDSATQYFEVKDNQVKSHGQDFYLLAITRRNGMLYFQAARPASRDAASHLQTIREFSAAVLDKLGSTGRELPAEDIAAGAQHEANLRGIQVRALTA